jgi:signal transduction histidine kinase
MAATWFTAADVTALGLAEAAAERGRLLDTVLGASRAGIAVFGADGGLVLCNHAYAALVGQPHASLQPGTTLEQILQRMQASGEFAHMQAAPYIAEVAGHDRRIPRSARRLRNTGQVLRFDSDPLPDGGFFVTVLDITAQTVAEDQAAQRGRLLDTVLESSHTGLAVYGPDQRLRLHNRAYAAMLGLAPGALSAGMHVAEVMHTLASIGELGNIDQASDIAGVLSVDRGTPHARRRTRPNGDVLDVTSAPMPDGGYVLSVTDVTALARAEDEARARAAMLEGVLAALPQGVSLFGPDRRARLVNPAHERIMGASAARVGEHMQDLIERRRVGGEFGPDEEAGAYAAAAASDFIRPIRRRRQRPDGTTIDIRTAPLPDGGHIRVVSDVTLEVSAQAKAEERSHTLDLMLAHVNHGLVLFDADDRVVLFNRNAEALSGIEPGWLHAGRSRPEIIAHLLARGIYGEGDSAVRQAQHYRGLDLRLAHRLQRILPDGRVVEMQTDPLPEGGSVVAIWDVTWQRQSEAALREAKEAAETASRAKSQFLATMSHELRTPLNAVIGFSDTIAAEAQSWPQANGQASDAPGLERIVEFAQAINDAGRHLLSLINEILDVARIEAGRVDLADEPMDMARLVAGARRMMDGVARAAGVALSVEIAPNLPLVRADERRLRQVLLNLLSNAVKFTPSGGAVGLTASVGADAWLTLAVQDTGMGIAPADLERAFDPFTQLDGSLARRFQGSGLGLFMSRALARAHGGTLTLSSTPGAGTTALLRLPPERLMLQATLPQETAP